MPCCTLCCLPVSQAVLRRFRRVSAVLVFHCQEKDKAEQWFLEYPLLEANNSAWKLPPPLIPPEIQRRDVAVPCPFTRFAIPPTDRSLAMLSSLAWSASKLLIRLVQTAVDPFTNRIVYQVTKISPARVANREIKIHVYAKRQTWICTTWPSFPLVFRLLFIASTQK